MKKSRPLDLHFWTFVGHILMIRAITPHLNYCENEKQRIVFNMWFICIWKWLICESFKYVIHFHIPCEIDKQSLDVSNYIFNF